MFSNRWFLNFFIFYFIFRKIQCIFLTVKPVLYTDAMVTVETLMINKYKAWNHDSVYCIRTNQINTQNPGSFYLQSIQQLLKWFLTLWYVYFLNICVFIYILCIFVWFYTYIYKSQTTKSWPKTGIKILLDGSFYTKYMLPPPHQSI